MSSKDMLDIYNIMLNSKKDIQAEIILNILRSNHNLNKKELLELINIINSIEEDYKLSCLKDSLKISGIQKNGKSLELAEVINKAKSKDNTDAIYNLIKNQNLSNNKHIIELCNIMLKDKNSSTLYIVIDAAKKLSLKNDEDIVLLTNIISDAINYNAACMTNLVSTTCQISNKDIKEKITLAISKCKDEEKARCLYHLAQKSNDLLNIFGYQETINVINKINKIDDYDYYDNSYQFINNYLEYIKKTNKNNYIKPSTVINIITRVKNKKNLPLFIDIIPTGILEKDNAIDYLNIIKSDIEYSKAISLIFINNKQNKKRILKKSS